MNPTLQARPSGCACGPGPSRQAGTGRLRRRYFGFEEGIGQHRLQLVSRSQAMPSSAEPKMESACRRIHCFAGQARF